MERREFLKLFGLGAAIVGAAAATMSPTQAASLLASPSADAPPSTDELVKEVAEKAADQGEFAQYYYYRRRRWRRPWYRRRRYFYRRRYYRRRYYW